MDVPAYHIHARQARHMVVITFDQTFWTTEIADRFRGEVLAAVAALGCPAGQHCVLVDLRNAVLQSQEVYERMLALANGATARRIALVASTPLARMQTRRLQIRDNIVMFAELAEAEAWLHEPSRAAA